MEQKLTYYILIIICVVFFCGGYVFCKLKEIKKYEYLKRNLMVAIPITQGEDIYDKMQFAIKMAGEFGGTVYVPSGNWEIAEEENE
jgi:hypothetical protein